MAPGLDDRRALYERLCESYHALDDFRMKLLGLLPLATGAGVLLLANGEIGLSRATDVSPGQLLGAIGAFGFVITLGLFAYELYGIKKCHYLIKTGQRLERELGIIGQFRMRPRELARFINEPFAASVIYPGSLAAWGFLGLVLASKVLALVAALAVLVVGFVASYLAWSRLPSRWDEDIEAVFREEDETPAAVRART